MQTSDPARYSRVPIPLQARLFRLCLDFQLRSRVSGRASWKKTVTKRDSGVCAAKEHERRADAGD